MRCVKGDLRQVTHKNCEKQHHASQGAAHLGIVPNENTRVKAIGDGDKCGCTTYLQHVGRKGWWFEGLMFQILVFNQLIEMDGRVSSYISLCGFDTIMICAVAVRRVRSERGVGWNETTKERFQVAAKVALKCRSSAERSNCCKYIYDCDSTTYYFVRSALYLHVAAVNIVIYVQQH